MPVTDPASASEAIKLSGLPVIVLAFNSAFLAIELLFNADASPALMFAFLALAIVLVVIAFRLRKGHAGYVPFVAALFPAFLALVVLDSFSGPPAAGGLLTQIFLVISKWIVPALAAILAYRGLKGWQWLRAQGTRMTF
ncbi:hypothetical protein F8B91_07245 [Aestuariivirga litoralis]|nr:hypothetical protein [Aestuariivirga litoralis]